MKLDHHTLNVILEKLQNRENELEKLDFSITEISRLNEVLEMRIYIQTLILEL
jgi:hypothetical protein